MLPQVLTYLLHLLAELPPLNVVEQVVLTHVTATRIGQASTRIKSWRVSAA